MSYRLIINSQDILCVSGNIDLTNVMQICVEGQGLIDNLIAVRVDLSEVQQADSSILAMLIEWIRSAKVQHKEIVFNNMPQFMLDLVRVCGLDAVLPIEKPLQFHN